MDRRDFIAGAGVAIGAVCVTGASARDSEASVKELVEKFYSIYYVEQNEKKYRAMLADDYLLLENGKIMSAAEDIALIPRPEDEYKRTDLFDFRSIKIAGDTAYAVYFLKSEATDKKRGHRKWEFLESAILRRSGKSWKVALLHSTRLAKATS